MKKLAAFSTAVVIAFVWMIFLIDGAIRQAELILVPIFIVILSIAVFLALLLARIVWIALGIAPLSSREILVAVFGSMAGPAMFLMRASDPAANSRQQLDSVLFSSVAISLLSAAALIVLFRFVTSYLPEDKR